MIKLDTEASKKNINKLINAEIISIIASLSTQKNLKKQILIFIKNFTDNIDIESDSDIKISNKIYDSITDAILNLKKINFNISSLEDLSKNLNSIKSNIALDNQNIISKIEKFNIKYTDVINKIFINNTNIQNFIHSISFLDLSVYEYDEKIEEEEETVQTIEHIENLESENTSSNVKTKSKKTKKTKAKEIVENANDVVVEETKDNPITILENTLIISEIQGKVILPYTLEDLKEITLSNPKEYPSIEDVIKKIYTKPIKEYKFSSISRFKEAYKLIVEREHGSKKAATNLAIELFSNYNLHPAIITSCKKLNELDVYLSCLEYNELNDFHFFKIKYEIAPATFSNTLGKFIKKFKKTKNNKDTIPQQ